MTPDAQTVEAPEGFDLSKMVDHYAICAVWSSNDDARDPEGQGVPLDQNYNAGDLSEEARASMTADCAAFAMANVDDLRIYFDGLGFDEENAGHDFWLTRNGHGAGFWDRYYGTDADLRAACLRLSAACEPFGESNLYAGDDSRLYLM